MKVTGVGEELATARFARAAGWTLGDEDWQSAYDKHAQLFSYGAVTAVDALRNAKGEAMPLCVRTLGDDSGALITAGYQDIRYGFLADQPPGLMMVSADERDPKIGHAFLDPVSETVQELVESVEFLGQGMKFVPVNPGVMSFVSLMSSEDDQAERSAVLAQVGITAMLDSQRLTVTNPNDGDFEDLVDELTDLDSGYGPITEVIGLICESEKLLNATTGLHFWRLTVEFARGKLMTCLAEHPFPSGIYEDFVLFPEGSIIRAEALLTGHVAPIRRDRTTRRLSPTLLTEFSEEWISKQELLQGGLPSSSSMSVDKRVTYFAPDFSEIKICTDIAGCVGFPVEAFAQLYWEFTHLDFTSVWASDNVLGNLEDEYSVLPSARGSAMITLAKPIRGHGRKMSCILGWSLPSMSWGVSLGRFSDQQPLPVYAAVDVNSDDFEEPDKSDWNALPVAAEGTVEKPPRYGDAVVDSAALFYPMLQRNPFWDLPFISVETELNGEDVIVVMPCPADIAELADSYGDGDSRVAERLRHLRGKTVSGRFDKCSLLIDDGNVPLNDFEQEIQRRTPPAPIDRRSQRHTDILDYCCINPEIAWDAQAVAAMEQHEELPEETLMKLLRTGPVGLQSRLDNIYEKYGVNIFPNGHKEWASERNTDDIAWVPMTTSQMNATIQACKTAKTWQKENFSWSEVDSVEQAMRGAASLYLLDEVSNEYGEPADPCAGDPSVQDYLTEDDSFDLHCGLLSRAIAQRQKMSVLYGNRDDEPTVRTILPVKIVVLHHTYVLAWDELRGAWRTFRVDRFKTCSLIEEHFQELEVSLPAEIPDETIEDIYDSYGGYIDNATVRVIWSVRRR